MSTETEHVEFTELAEIKPMQIVVNENENDNKSDVSQMNLFEDDELNKSLNDAICGFTKKLLPAIKKLDISSATNPFKSMIEITSEEIENDINNNMLADLNTTFQSMGLDTSGFTLGDKTKDNKVIAQIKMWYGLAQNLKAKGHDSNLVESTKRKLVYPHVMSLFITHVVMKNDKLRPQEMTEEEKAMSAEFSNETMSFMTDMMKGIGFSLKGLNMQK